MRRSEICRRKNDKSFNADFIQLFIEILSTYDLIKIEKYYNIAKKISDKLFDVSLTEAYLKINKFQSIKRK